PGRQKCKVPITEIFSLSVNLDRYSPLQDEHEALDFCLRLRMGETAARRYFNNELGEGGSTASNRPIQNPGPGILPFGQDRGDNIAKYPLRDKRISLGGYRTTRKDRVLLG